MVWVSCSNGPPNGLGVGFKWPFSEVVVSCYSGGPLGSHPFSSLYLCQGGVLVLSGFPLAVAPFTFCGRLVVAPPMGALDSLIWVFSSRVFSGVFSLCYLSSARYSRLTGGLSLRGGRGRCGFVAKSPVLRELGPVRPAPCEALCGRRLGRLPRQRRDN